MIVDVHVKNVTHLKELAKEFEFCEFIEAFIVKGFEPEGIFVAHLNLVGYSNLIGVFTPQEIEENPRSPKTIVSTNVR